MKKNIYNDWYMLDNSAKIFPEVSTRRETNTFRVEITMKEVVDPEVLDEAVSHVLKRFPMFKVRLKPGFFWSYLDYNANPFHAEKMTHEVCGAIDPKNNNGFLLKVLYYDKKIAVEIFHSLADGAGAFSLLKSIVYEYLSLMGFFVQSDGLVLTKDSRPILEEYEDSHKAYYDKHNRKHVTEKKAFRISGTMLPEGTTGLISGELSTKEILALAREKGASVTEYLSALMLKVIYENKIAHREHMKENKRPIKIFVPVDLRKHFPSRTLRNFSNFVKVGLRMDEKPYTFDDLLEETGRQFSEGLKKEELIRKMSENVSFEKNPLMRISPYILKKPIMKLGYELVGMKLNTMSLSNMGRILLPDSLKPHIESVGAAVYSGKHNTVNMAVASYLDRFRITFTRSIVETGIIRDFFRHFTQKGLNVTLESNYVEEWL